MRGRKGLKNADVKSGLFFFERYSLISAKVCEIKF